MVGQCHSGGAGLLTLVRIKAKPQHWIKRQGTILMIMVKIDIQAFMELGIPSAAGGCLPLYLTQQ